MYVYIILYIILLYYILYNILYIIYNIILLYVVLTKTRIFEFYMDPGGPGAIPKASWEWYASFKV